MKVLHIVLNSFKNDSRVMRSATAGLDIFHEVHVYALHDQDLPLTERVKGVNVRRFHLRSRRLAKVAWIQAGKFAELLIRMVGSGTAMKPTVVHAHDVHGLVIGYCIAKMVGAKLIYDSHEYWADVQGYRDLPPVFVRTFLGAQSALSRRSDAVITVCRGIADRLQAEIGLSAVDVIRNTPDQWNLHGRPKRLRDDLGLRSEDLVFLYQGGLSTGRGLERLLSAYIEADINNSALVFMGYGPMADQLRARVADAGVQERVHIIDAAHPDDLPWYTSDADIGVLPYEPVCESNNLALPNKLFEYMQGGLAVVASNLPEIDRVIHEEGVGITYSHNSTTGLARTMQMLASEPDRVRQYQIAAIRCRDKYCWETERNRLLQIYRRLLADNSNA